MGADGGLFRLIGAYVAFASFVYHSLVVLVIAFTGPFGYDLLPVKGGTILIDCSLCEEEASTGRLRFTCAHELGHWLLHKKQFSGTGENAALRSGNESDNTLEVQANLLGSILLLPLPQVKRCFYQLRSGRTNQQLVTDMAGIFQVSKQAMRIRLENHNLL